MPYFLAIAASVCFGGASLVFAELARRISPLWMNVFKAVVAWSCFGIASWLSGTWVPVSRLSAAALFVSGVLGLGVGDIFLLTAYARMGAARTLILFGFQPLFIGVAARILFGQEFTPAKLVAIFFFLACLFVFSLERYREQGQWEVWGLTAALLAVLFDNSGLLLSRMAFEQTAGLSAFQANFLRCSGALLFFAGVGPVRRVHLWRGWSTLDRGGRQRALLASVLGCFLSLYLYLTAVKIGHLASVTAIGVAGPILTAGMECVYLRRRPSIYLIFALLLFAAGFVVLNH